MPDLTTISAALNSIKTAIDIAKVLKDSDTRLEQAELKLQLANLIGSLADAKIEMIEAQDLLSEKVQTISELEEAFNRKGKLIRKCDAFYEIDSKGDPTGQPYCMNCWQVHHKAYELHVKAGDRHLKCCPVCKTEFSGRMTPIFSIDGGEENA